MLYKVNWNELRQTIGEGAIKLTFHQLFSITFGH